MYTKIILLLNLFSLFLGLAAYLPQLSSTNPLLWILVIDCPLAALFFSLFLLGFSNPYFEALSRTTALKYGLWTILVTFSSASILAYEYTWINLLLHLGLIVESFFFLKQRLLFKHFVPALIFLLLNDFSDYFLLTHPPINNSLFIETGIMTFLLTIISVLVHYYFNKKIFERKRSDKRIISS
jgi:uncharacterized membrane protein YpjA